MEKKTIRVCILCVHHNPTRKTTYKKTTEREDKKGSFNTEKLYLFCGFRVFKGFVHSSLTATE